LNVYVYVVLYCMNICSYTCNCRHVSECFIDLQSFIFLCICEFKTVLKHCINIRHYIGAYLFSCLCRFCRNILLFASVVFSDSVTPSARFVLRPLPCSFCSRLWSGSSCFKVLLEIMAGHMGCLSRQ